MPTCEGKLDYNEDGADTYHPNISTYWIWQRLQNGPSPRRLCRIQAKSHPFYWQCTSCGNVVCKIRNSVPPHNTPGPTVLAEKSGSWTAGGVWNEFQFDPPPILSPNQYFWVGIHCIAGTYGCWSSHVGSCQGYYSTEDPPNGTSGDYDYCLNLKTYTDVVYHITGVTRDANGNPLGGCTVWLFKASDKSFQQETTSDVNGNYSFTVLDDVTQYFIRSHKDGTPNIFGTTDRNLVGS